MDRSLNGDDFRLFSRWEREDHPERFAAASTLSVDDLPGWFRQLVREQAIELGCEALFPALFVAAQAAWPEAA